MYVWIRSICLFYLNSKFIYLFPVNIVLYKMAMASSSHVEESAVEDHEEDDGPLLISKLEV